MRYHKNSSYFVELPYYTNNLQTQGVGYSCRVLLWSGQHMDLQTVQSRLDKGSYLDSQRKFFRDLLLLFNNAIVFFGKNSTESIAARELRELVTKEMARAIPMPPKPDPERKQPSPFHSRPNKIAPSPIVVCRRRSSSASVRVPSEVAKTREAEAKLKTKNLNHHLSGNKAAQEKIIKKQGMKEKSELSRRSSRTSKKVGDTKNHSEDDDGDDDLESRVKWKESTKKNHGGSGYLKRVKQNYTSKDQVEEDSNDDDDDDDEMEREEKSRDRRRRDGKKEKESDKRGERERRTDGRREREREPERRDQRERSSQGKRGRPPKRVAVESRRDVGRGKRGRESGESEVAAADSGRSRKRYRR